MWALSTSLSYFCCRALHTAEDPVVTYSARVSRLRSANVEARQWDSTIRTKKLKIFSQSSSFPQVRKNILQPTSHYKFTPEQPHRCCLAYQTSPTTGTWHIWRRFRSASDIVTSKIRRRSGGRQFQGAIRGKAEWGLCGCRSNNARNGEIAERRPPLFLPARA